MNRFIKPFRKLVNKFGFDVVRREKTLPADLTAEEWSHPLELVNRYKGRDIILSVPVQDIYFQGDRGSKESTSFYIRTIADFLSGRCTVYEGSYLQRYYKEFQPVNIAEYLNIKIEEGSNLSNIEPLSLLYPWNLSHPNEKKKRIIEQQIREAAEYGLKLTPEDGHNLFGPVSYQKGLMEFNRLIEVANSIKENGFNTDLGYPIGRLNLDENERYVFTIKSGSHRVAALCAIGSKKIPIKIETGNIIRFREYLWWPQYISKTFNKDEVDQIRSSYFR